MSARNLLYLLLVALGASAGISTPAHATVFGEVQGIVHDPQHRPIAGAHVVLQSKSSALSKSIDTDPDGSFRLQAVPLGAYTLTVSQTGFASLTQSMTLASGTSPVFHFALQVAAIQESVSVSTQTGVVDADSVCVRPLRSSTASQ